VENSSLVRALTDDAVLRALIRHRRLTRAELAAAAGISKPTAGESVRRLTERGLVVDTGERTPGGRGRGRVGSYYALADAGAALAIGISPAGVVAECLDAYGDTLGRCALPARPAEIAGALREAVAAIDRRARLAVVSAADPVDRATGRLVQLPDSPFLVGELDPVALLAELVDGPVIVDNDVNWAARAEPNAPPDFVFLFLGEGLGCAVVSDGEIKRGSGGLAGEIAHLVTVGPGDRAVRLIDVFGALDLRQPGSTAIDVTRLLAGDAAVWATIGAAVGGVVEAAVALADPACVIVGGSWGPSVLDEIGAAVAATPRPVPVRAAAALDDPALTGARAEALRRLRDLVAASSV